MRAVTFQTPDGAEAYVSVLSGPAGGTEANINRWRNQMGINEPMAAADIANLPKIEVMGKQCPLIELKGQFTGMSGGPQTDAMLLGTVCELPGQTVFVKMTGPAAAVEANRDKFVAFSQSLAPGQAAAPQQQGAAAPAPAAQGGGEAAPQPQQ
jgi:hypothetical protein